MKFSRTSHGKVTALKSLGVFYQTAPGGNLEFYEFVFLPSGKLSTIYGNDGTDLSIRWLRDQSAIINGAIPGVAKLHNIRTSSAPEIVGLAQELATAVKQLNQYNFAETDLALKDQLPSSTLTTAGQISFILGESSKIVSVCYAVAQAAAAVELGAPVALSLFTVVATADSIAFVCDAFKAAGYQNGFIEAADNASEIADLLALAVKPVKPTDYDEFLTFLDKATDSADAILSLNDQLFSESNPGVTIQELPTPTSDQGLYDGISEMANGLISSSSNIKDCYQYLDDTIDGTTSPIVLARIDGYFTSMDSSVEQCEYLAQLVNLITDGSTYQSDAEDSVVTLIQALSGNVDNEISGVTTQLQDNQTDLSSQEQTLDSTIRAIDSGSYTGSELAQLVQVEKQLRALDKVSNDNIKVANDLLTSLQQIQTQLQTIQDSLPL